MVRAADVTGPGGIFAPRAIDVDVEGEKAIRSEGATDFGFQPNAIAIRRMDPRRPWFWLAISDFLPPVKSYARCVSPIRRMRLAAVRCSGAFDAAARVTGYPAISTGG